MAQRLQVLFVEDNPNDTELILRELRRAGFDPDWKRVDTEADYRASLHPGWDLILSDFKMPQFDGLRALALQKESGLEIPFIIVSGSIGEDIAVDAIKKGATDYLLKDRLARLGAAVSHALEQSRLLRESRKAAESLKLFRALVDRSNDAFEVVDPATARFLDVNDKGCADLGYTKEELLARRVFDVDPSVQEADWAPLMAELRRTGAMVIERIHQRKDGTTFPIEINMKWVQLDREYVVVVVRDITERKKAEGVMQQAAAPAVSSRRKSMLVDFTVLGILAVAIFILAGRYDWFEAVTLWILRYDEAQLDEMLLTIIFVAFGLVVIAFRRWRESEKEITARQQVQEALSLLHNDLDLRVKQRTAELVQANEALLAEAKERQQAQAALKLFRTLVDRSNDAFEVIDPATARYLDVNEKACANLGYTREEILSRRLFDIVPGVAEATWPEQVRQVREKGSLILETTQRRKDGAVFPVEVNIKWVRLDRDYIVAVVRDITERKEVEKEVARMQARFQFIFDSVPVGIAWMKQGNPASRIVNAAHARITGVPVDQCRRLELYRQATPPEDQARQDVLHQRLKAGDVDRYTVEKRYVRPDGSVCWVALTIRVFRDEVSGDVQEISTVVDLTEHKQAEAALQESHDRFRQIAENINEVFWVTDPAKNQMLYISPAYEKIWGRTCASLYAAPGNWLEAIHPEDRERVLTAAKTKQSLGDYNEIYRINRPDGSLRWVHDRAFPIRNADGQVYRIVGTAEDITNHHKLEEQFRQAQKMEAIGTLAGGIAHDFNNILSAINGYAELSKMKLGNKSPIYEYLDHIAKAGARATALVRQILTFSRQQEQSREAVQLAEVVDESVKLLRASIPSTIEMVVSLPPGTHPVLADSTQIHQIVMNLGTNAWHAMRDRVGRLEVKLENYDVEPEFAATQPKLRPGPYVRLSISDTGKGMDAATLERIFEPFFTTKPVGEGTGLGLSVVHGIMESHDGVITVYSQPGEGTIFHLYFPAHQGAMAAGATPDQPIPQGHGRHILYVDDEEVLARLGQQTLEQLGYQVEVSTHVTEALDWVRQNPKRFDLVITDQTMPGMTGVEFAAQLLKIRADLPIILTTGYSPYLTTERVRALGMRELLLKPHTLNTLGMAVHQALGGGRSG